MSQVRTRLTALLARVCAPAILGLVLSPAAYPFQHLEAQIPAAEQSRPIALTGGTIHPVSGPSIEDGTLVFEGGLITAIGTAVDVPSGALEVNLEGRHVYPGLIDANSSVGLFEIGGWDVTIDLEELGDINPNVRAQVAFNPESRHIGTTRSAGVLVAVSSPAGGLISGQAAAMALDGWSWEQMTLAAPVGMVVNWPGTGNQEQYRERVRVLREAFDEARAYRTARLSERGAEHPEDARWEAMIPVFSGDIPLIVDADGVQQIQDAVAWAEEEELRIVIRGGQDAGFVADHLAARQIPVLLSAVQDSPGREWEGYDGVYSLPARLYDAGVRFGIAGSSSAPYAHRLPWEAGTAVAFGLPEGEALRAVTLSPAEFLGIDDRVGSLEVGKDANLLITTGSPLEYHTQIEQIFIQGRDIDLMDAHREFYEKYSQKVRQMSPGSDR
ncbi:MAG: amidohydrolase family protein [Gemmatimonadota bacterium]